MIKPTQKKTRTNFTFPFRSDLNLFNPITFQSADESNEEEDEDVSEWEEEEDDDEPEQYVALKVQKSAQHYTEAAMDEITILQQIADGDKEDKKCVVKLLDHFKHSSPNGQHVCMVFDYLGDNLLTLIKQHSLIKQLAAKQLWGKAMEGVLDQILWLSCYERSLERGLWQVHVLDCSFYRHFKAMVVLKKVWSQMKFSR